MKKKFMHVVFISFVSILSGCGILNLFQSEESTISNQVKNGDFSIIDETDENFSWLGKVHSDAFYGTDASFNYSNENVKVSILDSEECTPWAISLSQPVSIIENVSYRLEFRASSTTSTAIKVSINKATAPWNFYFATELDITSSVATYTYDFTMEELSDHESNLDFSFGQAPVGAVVTIDDVSLIQIEDIMYLPSNPEPLYSGVIANGDFSSGIDYWTFYSQEVALGNVRIENEYAHVMIIDGDYEGYQIWHIELKQPHLLIEQGKTYKIEFDAWSDGNRGINAICSEDGVDNNNDGNEWSWYSGEYFDIGTERNTYSHIFTMDSPTDEYARLIFELAGSDYDVYFDDISLIEIE